MNPQNGTATAGDGFGALGANFKLVSEYISQHSPTATAPASAEPAKGWFARAAGMIRRHPLAAIGLAFGAGYLLTRIARR